MNDLLNLEIQLNTLNERVKLLTVHMRDICDNVIEVASSLNEAQSSLRDIYTKFASYNSKLKKNGKKSVQS